MKYYIPTSTLNFNNILSSESISPEAFYSLRRFGYKRFHKIQENNLPNVLLLYKEPFQFTRPESDVEDHPMMIEIETDETFPTIEEGIFYCDHTIYLSPWKTKIILFSEQDRRVSFSLSDSSSETKLIPLYIKRIIVNENYPLQKKNILEVDFSLNRVEIEKDFYINKMKGLLYGYYIGSLLSTNQEIVKKANILQELQNIFSAVLSSESRIPTVLQEGRLTALFNELQESHPMFLYFQKILKETENTMEVIKTLRVNFGASFPELIEKDSIISSLKYSTEEHNLALNWLKTERESLKTKKETTRHYLQPSDKEIVTEKGKLHIINNTCLTETIEQEVTKTWTNDVMLSKDYDGKVSTFAKELSDILTQKAKEVCGDLWEKSSLKIQLNEMRRYVRGAEANINWGDNIVSSIASVLAKGYDWEQLLSFMQSKYMTDYRLAFAFYGELNGFANLTRDFTDNLFDLQDKFYISEIYKDIYVQLYNSDPTIPKENESENTLKDAEDSNELYYWQQEIKDAAMKVIKKRKKEMLLSLEEAFLENGNNQDYGVFFDLLLKKDGWHNNKGKPLKALIDLKADFASIITDKPETCNKHDFHLEPDLFEKEEMQESFASPEESFYQNQEAWNEIQNLLPPEIKEKVKTDFIWFQEEYQKGGNSRYYAKASRENAKVIEALSRYFMKKEYIKEKYVTIIEEITRFLHAKYDK